MKRIRSRMSGWSIGSLTGSVGLGIAIFYLFRLWTRLESEYGPLVRAGGEDQIRRNEQARAQVSLLVRTLALLVTIPLCVYWMPAFAPVAAVHAEVTAALVIGLAALAANKLPFKKIWDQTLDPKNLGYLSAIGAVVASVAVITLSADGVFAALVKRFTK